MSKAEEHAHYESSQTLGHARIVEAINQSGITATETQQITMNQTSLFCAENATCDKTDDLNESKKLQLNNNRALSLPAGIKPYYLDDKSGIAIFNCDCREVLPTLGRVDHVITDPPYNVRSADIELEGRSAMKRDFGKWDEEWQAAPFVDSLTPIVRAGGSLLSFTSDRLISQFRETNGWKPRGTLVWVKDNPAPHPRPAYVQATEFVVWLQREGAAAVWNGNGYTLNVLRASVCAGDERTEHPTQKPLNLITELIQRHTNTDDLILDPFMGSGTTLRAAKDLGRRAIGIELEEKYCEIAALRLAQEVLC